MRTLNVLMGGLVLSGVGLGGAACASAAAGRGEPPAGGEAAAAPANSTYVLDHTVKDVDGHDVKLSTYKGRVLLIVNVASQCGLTKSQYPALQRAYELKKDQGFEVIAFPANDFREQEPGTNAEIKAFCSEQKVTFPLMGKISVLGKDQHPLFKQLAGAPAPAGGEPTWNFTKYLVNRRGEVVLRLDPRTAPDSADVLKKIDELLAEKSPEAPAPTTPTPPAPSKPVK